MPLPPNDIETLVENEAAFRTWVITSLSELQSKQDALPAKAQEVEKRLTRVEKSMAWGAGVGTILLAIVRFARF